MASCCGSAWVGGSGSAPTPCSARVKAPITPDPGPAQGLWSFWYHVYDCVRRHTGFATMPPGTRIVAQVHRTVAYCRWVHVQSHTRSVRQRTRGRASVEQFFTSGLPLSPDLVLWCLVRAIVPTSHLLWDNGSGSARAAQCSGGRGLVNASFGTPFHCVLNEPVPRVLCEMARPDANDNTAPAAMRQQVAEYGKCGALAGLPSRCEVQMYNPCQCLAVFCQSMRSVDDHVCIQCRIHSAGPLALGLDRFYADV